MSGRTLVVLYWCCDRLWLLMTVTTSTARSSSRLVWRCWFVQTDLSGVTSSTLPTSAGLCRCPHCSVSVSSSMTTAGVDRMMYDHSQRLSAANNAQVYTSLLLLVVLQYKYHGRRTPASHHSLTQQRWNTTHLSTHTTLSLSFYVLDKVACCPADSKFDSVLFVYCRALRGRIADSRTCSTVFSSRFFLLLLRSPRQPSQSNF